MTAAIFLAILLVDLLAAMSPGPTFLVAVRTAAVEGFRPAAGYAAGVGIASAVWASAALFGLAAVFQLAPALFMLLKVAGGGFLVWIAVETWRHADAPLPEAAPGTVPRTMPAAVRLGFLTQLANPKSAVFYGSVFAGLVPHGSSLAPCWPCRRGSRCSRGHGSPSSRGCFPSTRPARPIAGSRARPSACSAA